MTVVRVAIRVRALRAAVAVRVAIGVRVRALLRQLMPALRRSASFASPRLLLLQLPRLATPKENKNAAT